jgi:hypothetical protein
MAVVAGPVLPSFLSTEELLRCESTTSAVRRVAAAAHGSTTNRIFR